MKIGILICTYNRPEYLRECLESLQRTRLPSGTAIYIVDDASTNPETKRLIHDFSIPDIVIGKFFKKENRSIKDSLLFGCDLLWNGKVDLITNLDSDAVVSNNFLETLLDLKIRFPEHLITGFNCLTRNNDGSERHKVLMEGDGFNLKKSVGGLNMMFDEHQYNKWIRPTLEKAIQQNLNWDDHTCRASMKDGKEIVCAVPSVCQHIGINSSMGHAHSEKPDTAEDFKPLHLPDVTLIGVDGANVDRLINAANVSCKDIKFGAVKILSHLPSDDPRVVKIRPIKSKKDYSQFILKELVDYVHTDYLLVFQHDGFVLNYKGWDDEYFNWDWVGASWKFRPEKRTANGGFSLRSKRICEAIRDDEKIFLQNDHIITNFAEDHVLMYIYREYLEAKHNIKIAPEEVCDKFSIEAWGVSPPGNKYSGQFGFHGYSVDFADSKLSYTPY